MGEKQQEVTKISVVKKEQPPTTILPKNWERIQLKNGIGYIGTYITPYGKIPGLIIRCSANNYEFYYRWGEGWEKRCFMGRVNLVQGIIAVERWLTEAWKTLQKGDRV